MSEYSNSWQAVGANREDPRIPYGERVWAVVDVDNVAVTASKCFGRAHINWGRFFSPIRNARWRHIELISSNRWVSGRQRAYLERAWGAEIWDAKKNADALVSGSLLRGSRQAHRLILCAGDDDYADVVDFLRSKGLIVEVWAFAQSLAPELGDICDSVRILGRDVLFPNNGTRSRARPATNPIQMVPHQPSNGTAGWAAATR